MSWSQMQMTVLAVLAVVITVASISYILIAKPAYLRASVYGVPFYSPQVINPVTNKPMDLNALSNYYMKGKKK